MTTSIQDEIIKSQVSRKKQERWALIGFLTTQLESLDAQDVVILADSLLGEFIIKPVEHTS